MTMSLLNMMTLAKVSADGATITIVGILIVFTVLAFLAIAFTLIAKSLTIKIKRNLKEEGHEVDDTTDVSITGCENAAISMALYLYFNEMHDEESGVITISSVKKRYSPWSSKIYGLNNVGY